MSINVEPSGNPETIDSVPDNINNTRLQKDVTKYDDKKEE